MYQRDFCDPSCVGRLHETFVQRVNEELRARQLSDNEVARQARAKGYTISQSSVTRIRSGSQEPSLTALEAISYVLGLPEWTLLVKSNEIEQRVVRPSSNIARFPSGYPRIGSASDDKARVRPRKTIRR